MYTNAMGSMKGKKGKASHHLRQKNGPGAKSEELEALESKSEGEKPKGLQGGEGVSHAVRKKARWGRSFTTPPPPGHLYAVHVHC